MRSRTKLDSTLVLWVMTMLMVFVVLMVSLMMQWLGLSDVSASDMLSMLNTKLRSALTSFANTIGNLGCPIAVVHVFSLEIWESNPITPIALIASIAPLLLAGKLFS